ncbi:ammonium transporter [Nguyenibacter vanlangensis]|uniref:Ammonium transporter n=1 Tax=Nguyenibacter vanlangensis TaxID=1216886 RepID=A0A7Y7ITJ7_9PROT|nr:ammonium transporter [Nguyenibacter vanlangensis]NVN09897.1 ammonium transporter [Nguyenibacter vanlangensis]
MTRFRFRPLLVLIPALFLTTCPALAADGASPQSSTSFSAADTAWLMVASVFTTLMLIPGLALFYSGMLRKKNALSASMQAICTGAVVSLVWIVCGYSLVFTASSPVIGGLDQTFLRHLTPFSISSAAPTVPEFVFVMFELTFATITPMIILGGPADRMRFDSAMLFVGLWTLAVYCPIAHMIWGPGGLLLSAGALDFAGGTVVHVTSGVAGLVAALMIGPRREYGVMDMAPHNVLLTLLGGSLLWGGWFCFNGGSALTAGPAAGLAILNSQIAAAAGTTAWVLGELRLHGKPSLLGAISGAIAGLVVITPGCGFVSPASALIMGMIGGMVCLWGVNWPKRRFHYDDALDVWAIHGIGGIMGALLAGVFATARMAGAGHSGVIDGHWWQLIVQSEAVLVVVAWTLVVTVLLLLPFRYFRKLRVSEDQEQSGLDLSLHGETIHD